MPDHDLHRCDALPAFVEELRRGARRWLCTLGDSNTCNTHFTAGAKQWPELVHQGLKEAAATQTLMLANAGVSGDTVTKVLDRFDHDVARVRPDITIVCLGTNDANQLDDAAFEAGMQALLDRLDAGGSRIALRTPAPMWERQPSRIWPGDAALRAKVELIRSLAGQRSLALIDTYAGWQHQAAAGTLQMERMMTDEVHTNAAGHRLIADQVLGAFGASLMGR